MSKKQLPYAPEYRRQMVELVRAGRTPGELAREFECSAAAMAPMRFSVLSRVARESRGPRLGLAVRRRAWPGASPW